jgi:endonuclease/exonuclease/phosphatase family metal-dependent hydrolase
VRVVTWNLWWRFGPWEERQPAIERTLVDAEPDVVMLQEVWATQDGVDQAGLLADALGLHHLRPPLRFDEGVSFGTAVLSRWPVTASATAWLPGRDGRPGHRQALAAHIDHPDATFAAITTHLSYEFDGSVLRQAQADELVRFVADQATAIGVDAIVLTGGDLNAVPDSDEIRMLTGRRAPPVEGHILTDAWEVAGDGSPGWTWCPTNPYVADSAWPRRRIDYLFVSWPRPRPRGNPRRAWLIGTEPVDGIVASDHYGVAADIEW